MVYTYDGLDRLQEAERGAPGSGGTFSHAPGSRQWDLDMLGNWSKIFTDTSGDGDYLDTGEEHRRGHNDVNEILGIDTDADGTDELDLAHDDNGNLREQDLTTSPSATAYRYTHDLWNRLVKVEHVTDPGGTETLVTKSEYEYFGTHWRSIKTSDSDDSGGIDEKREQYYTAGWQLIEERIDDSWTPGSGFSADHHMQYLWGTRYIDDIIMHREDTGGDGDFDALNDQSWWHLTDVQFSTVAVVNDNAVLQERIAYDPYGRALHHDDKDIDGDRDFDQDDRDIIDTIVNGGGANIEDAAYNVDADLDRDGAIDSTDQSTANNASDAAALATGELSNATVQNTIGWDGYVFNAETREYLVRYRCYSPALGRWLQRDPIGYSDGPSLYEGMRSRTLVLTDPLGTSSQVSRSEQPDDGSAPSGKTRPASKRSACYDECVSGCPRKMMPYPHPHAGPGAIIFLPDRACVDRCRMMCNGRKEGGCTPSGKVEWGQVNLKPGTSQIGFSIGVIGEDPDCCSEFAVIQFVRYRMWPLPWSGWRIDDGRVGWLSEPSPAPPFYGKPVPVFPDGRRTFNFNDEPSTLFHPRFWEFKVVVMCSAGPAAGHVYGVFTWNVGTSPDGVWSAPNWAPIAPGAIDNELPPLLK